MSTGWIGANCERMDLMTDIATPPRPRPIAPAVRMVTDAPAPPKKDPGVVMEMIIGTKKVLTKFDTPTEVKQ